MPNEDQMCKGLNTELDKDTEMQSNSELEKVFETSFLKQALKISPKKTHISEVIKTNRLESSPKQNKKNEQYFITQEKVKSENGQKEKHRERYYQ